MSSTASFEGMSSAEYEATTSGLTTVVMPPHTMGYYQQVSWWLFVVAVPLLTVVGLVGNTISMVVVPRSDLGSSSVCIHIIVLAVADSATLILNFANNWTKIALGVDTLRVSSTGCTVSRYLYDVFSSCSAWYVVTMAMERFIVVWFPFRARTICTRKSAIVSACAVLAIIALVNAYQIGIWHYDASGRCVIHVEHMVHIYSLLSSLLYAYLPILLLLFCSITISLKLAWLSKTRSKMTSSARGDEADRKVTVMVVVICLLFLMLTLPVTLFYIVWFAMPVATRRQNEAMEVVKTVVQLLSISNNAINFFLYTLASKAFQKELRVMCCKWRSWESDPGVLNGGTTEATKTSSVSESADSAPVTVSSVTLALADGTSRDLGS